MYTYYISVGSNVGDRRRYIEDAFHQLESDSRIHRLVSSSIMETPPWGFTEQASFLNAVWQMQSSVEPHEVLHILQALEQKAKRERSIHWGPRTLDLDIIYVVDTQGGRVDINDEKLQVPHPHFWNRLFVLEPMMELVGTFSYDGESISERIKTLQS